MILIVCNPFHDCNIIISCMITLIILGINVNTAYCKNIVEVQVVYNPKKQLYLRLLFNVFVLLGGVFMVWITITLIYC